MPAPSYGLRLAGGIHKERTERHLESLGQPHQSYEGHIQRPRFDFLDVLVLDARMPRRCLQRPTLGLANSSHASTERLGLGDVTIGCAVRPRWEVLGARRHDATCPPTEHTTCSLKLWTGPSFGFTVRSMTTDNAPQPTKPPAKFPAAGFILIGVLVGLFYAVCGDRKDKPPAPEPAAAPARYVPPPAPPPLSAQAEQRNKDIDLILACRKMVKQSLRAPDQSKMPGWLDETPEITTLRDGRRRWQDWVKAMNPYGVLLKQTVVCTYNPKTDKLKMEIKEPDEDE